MSINAMIVLGTTAFIIVVIAIILTYKCKKNSANTLRCEHISVLTCEKILPFFDGLIEKDYTGIVICYPLYANVNDIPDIHCTFSKIFENKKGVALIWCDSNKNVVKTFLYSFDSMDKELSDMLKKGHIQEKGYSVIVA